MMTAYPRDERAGGAEPEMVRMRLSGPVVAAALVAPVLLLGGPAWAKEEQYKCAMGRDCFLYLPDEMDANRTYWLVVGVHAYRGKGKGAAGLAGWVKKGNCVVVGPSFPNGYQMLGHESDKQLIGVLGELHKKYKLHKKVFLYGFSGGSQFAHRFAMKYPELVGGCASHSGGSWGTVNPKARGVLFAVSTGESDRSQFWLYAADGTLLSEESLGSLSPRAVWWDDDQLKEVLRFASGGSVPPHGPHLARGGPS